MAHYPCKRVSYPLFGQVICDSLIDYGTHFVPTNGSGVTTHRGCDGTLAQSNISNSNQLGYMKDNGWSFKLGSDGYQLNNPDIASPGTGKTVIEDFGDTWVNLMDDNNLKWWLDIENAVWDWSAFNLTYQSPISTYETLFGDFLDYVESNYSTNFEGYCFETAYTNCVQWLHDRTTYSVSEKDYSGWSSFETDSHGVNVRMGTNLNGSDISPMPTALQRVGLLDELVVEVFFQQFFTDWTNFLPAVRAAYPNLPIVINIDQVCSNESWSGTPPAGSPVETGVDDGWWAAAGVGEPSARCAAEQAGAISRITSIKNTNGQPFDGLIYNWYRTCYPYATAPDMTWYMAWAETNIVPLLKTAGNTINITPPSKSCLTASGSPGKTINHTQTCPNCLTASRYPDVINNSGFSVSKNITMQVP